MANHRPTVINNKTLMKRHVGWSISVNGSNKMFLLSSQPKQNVEITRLCKTNLFSQFRVSRASITICIMKKKIYFSKCSNSLIYLFHLPLTRFLVKALLKFFLKHTIPLANPWLGKNSTSYVIEPSIVAAITIKLFIWRNDYCATLEKQSTWHTWRFG